MRTIRLLAVAAATIATCGCFQSTAVIKVNADGSGTVEQRTIMTAAALAQFRQLAGAFGGADGKLIDPFSEDDARRAAEQLGEGVTFVSSTPITVPEGEGRSTLYAFRDITKVRVNDAARTPASGGIATPDAFGASGGRMDFVFDLRRTEGGNALLTLRAPFQGIGKLLNAQSADTGRSRQASELVMMRQMLAGLRMAVHIEPSGPIVRTTSPYVEGQSVTLFDLDLDELLKDEAVLTELQRATTTEELSAALKTTRGLKLNLEPEIIIEFTPTR